MVMGTVSRNTLLFPLFPDWHATRHQCCTHYHCCPKWWQLFWMKSSMVVSTSCGVIAGPGMQSRLMSVFGIARRQGIEGHGNAIPLIALPRSAGQVLILLQTQNTEFGRLLDQASSSQPPQSFSATNLNLCHYWFREHQIEHSKEDCNQVLCQEHSIATIICTTVGSKTKNNCNQRRLNAQRQGCVRLADCPSWEKDI